MDTAKFAGEVGRGITVHTNDPARPNLFLTLRATVVGSVLLLPRPDLRLSNRREDQQVARLLVRRDPGETGELRIGETDSTVPWITVSATRVEAAQPGGEGLPPARPGDWLLEARLRVPATYGRLRAAVAFTTDLARQPRVEVPVVVDLKPPVVLSKGRLVLAPTGDGPTFADSVLVSVRRGLDPAGLSVDADPSTLETELVPAGERAFTLRVRSASPGPQQGRIRFHVGGESYSLPVSGGR